MTQQQLEALLGRPLTQNEIDNLSLYLNIATESLEDLLCIDLCGKSSAKVFDTRQGYHTVFTGIFSQLYSVSIDGEELPQTDYYAAQGDNRNGKWFNSIVLKHEHEGEVTVEAKWGFKSMPSDLQKLYAELFANSSKQYTTGGKVLSKQVEDFRITYAGDSGTDDQNLIDKNSRTISKYSQCNMGYIEHGDVCNDRIRRFY